MRLRVLALCALVPACASVPPRQHEISCPESDKQSSERSDTFAWSEKGPLEFLQFLKSLNRQGSGRLGFTVECQHRGWVTEADIPELMKLLDSKEECAGVISPLSSWVPPDFSSVGQEALFLIDGFRKGVYPPGLASQRHGGSAEEVRTWWKNYRSARPSRR